MRFHLTPTPLLHLITTILLTPQPIAAKPHALASAQAGFAYNELFARWQCSGQLCGYNDQLCCSAGSACYTDSSDQAQCSATAGGSYGTSAAGGHWAYYTTTYTQTDLQTVTSVISSYVPGYASATITAAATASARCNYALNETPCGGICCAGNQYCEYSGQCAAALNSDSSAYSSSYTAPGAPIRGTSSALTVVTQTASPTTTVPFMTPVATGANVTTSSAHVSSGGLSGGAIAGIVIGVLVGLLILGLICFYCCLKGLLDGCLALFGLGGRKRRRTTEVDEYERRTHHSSGGGGRTWYGASRPSRVQRTEKRKSNFGRDVLGLGGGLAALWAILGLKRRNSRRNQEKYSEGSYSSEYYTSASE